MEWNLEVFVAGEPVPQGNHRVSATGHIYDAAGRELTAWRDAIAWTIRGRWHGYPPLKGPVEVELGFGLPRGASVKREYPSVRPDIDKLTRSVLDALTMAGVWMDDAQVVRLVAAKQYVGLAHARGDERAAGGVMIRVRRSSDLMAEVPA